MPERKKIAVLGAAIKDILAGPVDFSALKAGSLAMDTIRESFGGDALNEAVILSRLGADVELVTLLGEDQAGKEILSFLDTEKIESRNIAIDPAIPTGINVVLIDQNAQRYFLTNPQSSLRKLSEKEILAWLDQNPAPSLISFASLFVSSLLDMAAMEKIFLRIKQNPDIILAADMTKAKNGENLQTMASLLPCIDILFGNEEEIALICQSEDLFCNVKALIEAGAGIVAVKRGALGALIYDGSKMIEIPAFPESRAVDTTGAGDAFAAGFLHAFLEERSLIECGLFGTAAASLVIEQYGAVEGFNNLDLVWSRFEFLKEQFK